MSVTSIYEFILCFPVLCISFVLKVIYKLQACPMPSFLSTIQSHQIPHQIPHTLPVDHGSEHHFLIFPSFLICSPQTYIFLIWLICYWLFRVQFSHLLQEIFSWPLTSPPSAPVWAKIPSYMLLYHLLLHIHAYHSVMKMSIYSSLFPSPRF